MSGHSHFAGIKHKKALTDSQKGKAFSKLAREIAIAVRDGESPETNAKLRAAIEKAKAMNMPKENIDRAIKKGSGGEGGEKLEEFLFEAYGPGGIAVLIEGITDNKNRTLGELKQSLNQHGGKLVEAGSVKWLFERKGVITVNLKPQNQNFKTEDLELSAIEAGAEDIYWHEDAFGVFSKPGELEAVKKSLEEKGIKTESAGLEWMAKEEKEVSRKDKGLAEKLFEALDENEAVSEIYSNLRL